MKSRVARSSRRRVTGLNGIDILECKQLLSTAGTAGDVVEVDRSQPVAVAAPPAAAEAVSPGSSDASSTPTRDGAPSQPVPGPRAASNANTASTEGDTSPEDAGQAIAETQAVPGQPAALAIGLDVPGNGLLGPSNPASGNIGLTGSAADPPAADQPGDLGWTIDAGVARSDEIEEATMDGPVMSLAVSVPSRSDALVNGGAVMQPSDHGLSALELEPDSAPLRSPAPRPFPSSRSPRPGG